MDLLYYVLGRWCKIGRFYVNYHVIGYHQFAGNDCSNPKEEMAALSSDCRCSHPCFPSYFCRIKGDLLEGRSKVG